MGVGQEQHGDGPGGLHAGRRAGAEDGQSWVTTAVPVAACSVGTEDEERTTTDKTCSFDRRGHSSSHVGRTCAGGFRGDGGLLCAHARLCVSGGLLLSASSPSASGHQVEYLYSLVYQALDFISGKK